MDKKDFWSLVMLLIGGLSYSIISFAYMQSTFASKDILIMIEKRLGRIENHLINHKK